MKIFNQFPFRWCCNQLLKFQLLVKNLISTWLSLGAVNPPLTPIWSARNSFNHFTQVNGGALCGGVCGSPFRYAALVYGLLCYGKKAKRNGWPCLCRSMVWSVVLISLHLTLGESRGWLASLWVFLGGAFCCGALCACVCWFPCPKSFSQYPTYNCYSKFKASFLIYSYDILSDYKRDTWHSMQLTVSQNLYPISIPSIVVYCKSLTCFLPLSFMDKGKNKISEQLFSEVVRTTSVEVKNSSPSVGDANSSPSGGKNNKQKNKRHSKKLAKIKSKCEVGESFDAVCSINAASFFSKLSLVKENFQILEDTTLLGFRIGKHVDFNKKVIAIFPSSFGWKVAE